MEHNQPIHPTCPYHSNRWLSNFSVRWVGQIYKKYADFDDTLPGTTFLTVFKVDVDNGWEQNLAAGQLPGRI